MFLEARPSGLYRRIDVKGFLDLRPAIEARELIFDRGRGEVSAPAGPAQNAVVVLLTARERQPHENKSLGPVELGGQGSDTRGDAPWL